MYFPARSRPTALGSTKTVLYIEIDFQTIWPGPTVINRQGGSNQTNLCKTTKHYSILGFFGMEATICIGLEIQCLPYAGFWKSKFNLYCLNFAFFLYMCYCLHIYSGYLLNRTNGLGNLVTWEICKLVTW